jgi:uncharacterized protein
MSDRLISPSGITAWLDCEHFLALKHQVDAGLLKAPAVGMGSFAELLAAKGIQHELACLADYESQGKSVLRVDPRERGESFASWVGRVGDPFDQDYDVIYQMPLVHEGIRGIADFLVRTTDNDGRTVYEPVDAKLARKEAKPGHVLQLCFYADAIEAATGRRPRRIHLWLGSGNVESLDVDDFAAYWRRLRSQLAGVLAAPVEATTTRPEPCTHCAFCQFAVVCGEQWRSEDSLVYVAGLRSRERAVIEAAGVATLAELAVRNDPVEGMRDGRFAQVREQARLQVEARADAGATPPYALVSPGEDTAWGHGFEMLPEPDDGDVFLDFEGHPFWRADRGLFFLFGLIERDGSGEWQYRTWWAHSVEEEGVAAGQLIDYLAERRSAYPAMHVYHYNHTERSSLERLALEHGTGEVTLAHLVETGAFVDLLVATRNAVQIGAESYSLKEVERLTGYERGHEIDQGSGAVLEYEVYMTTGDNGALERIAAYNEDDVRATRALRDWLVARRPDGLPWRAAELEPDEGIPELDEQVERLHAFGPDTVEHLLGDVLGYWRREWLAHLAPLVARCQSEPHVMLDDPEVLTGLTHVGEVVRIGARGQELAPGLRFAFPAQETAGMRDGDRAVFVGADGSIGHAGVDRLDPEAGEVDLKWSETAADRGVLPVTLVLNGWVSPNPKPSALSELSKRVLDPSGGTPNPVAMALLRRDLPAFVANAGPAGGIFSSDLDEMLGWAPHLDRSYVAIQGPPGTGKTYRGAHLVLGLIRAGKRVGITAMSHHAIDNLLEAVAGAAAEAGDAELLRVVRRVSNVPAVGLPHVDYTKSNKTAASSKFNLVAGTTWLFSGKDMTDSPVDVLIIDEAGQLALADALAATRSAANLVLLGDPLQLPQVAQASHPGGAGSRVLEHVLGEHATIPPERGVFLSETRRMHPDVCAFISEEIYEGRLTSHESCVKQSTEYGTGLRWLRADHSGRVTESEEEAALVHDEVRRLIGSDWTDQDGATRPLTVDDVLVVAPYNDQVAMVRARLDDDPLTRGVAVGTVDKFQGREAAVVFFTMTTSTAADISRSGEFLFSRNRFNVAVSRARCLAYLVCTEDLLNSRGRTLEEMRLLSTICAFVERTP